MRMPSIKFLWFAIGLASAALAAGSIVLTAWMDLHPCHLCIFQRLLFMLITALGFAAVFERARHWAGPLVMPLAVIGAVTAGYQSWLQAQPPAAASCVAADPSPIELLVDWLGQQAPSLFLATGYCGDTELVILGLSLANGSLLAFTACLGVGAWALRAHARGRG